MRRSYKEKIYTRKILTELWGKPLKIFKLLLEDKEVQNLQEYANIVSITRLNYNDHGPVHMRKVVLNALKMLKLLHEAGIKFNLEKEKLGNFEDVTVAVISAGFLHDIGMTVGRENHELTSTLIAYPIINNMLRTVYHYDTIQFVALRSIIIEGIIGHMATQKIHSLEAGVILVADGCDMEKGRARIPLKIHTDAMVGDIHKYSASEIEKVTIKKGREKPIRIEVVMQSAVGFFQVEEVLLRKVNYSTIKPYIELFAKIKRKAWKQYL